MDEYTIKKDFYTIYIKWLVSNRLGWGAFSVPLGVPFLHYYCTEPAQWNGITKRLIKKIVGPARAYFDV